MIRAAVIGGIGSGKTFVANLFKCPVFNADDEVKIIYKTNKSCFNKLKKNVWLHLFSGLRPVYLSV